MRIPRPWYLEPALVLEFGQVLNAGHQFGDADAALYYFEKPHKWDMVHDVWRRHERPHEDEPGWQRFLDEIDQP